MAVSLLALFAAGLFPQVGKSAPTLMPGRAAPPIQVARWIKHGPPAKGRVMVVEFWATWCLPCKRAIPHLTQLAKKYHGKVDFVGVSVMEKGDAPLALVQKCVAGFGSKMDYHVALDDGDFMRKNWLNAAGLNAIPATFVVDGQGRVAWIGNPLEVEPVLRSVLAGTWKNEASAASFAEKERLGKIDAKINERLNPLVRDPKATLVEIGRILAEAPGLKYYPHVGHFTFNALVRIDRPAALAYAREWMAFDPSYPPYGDLTDMVSWFDDLGPDLNAFAAEVLEDQIRRSAADEDRGSLYDRIAFFSARAGDKPKALAAARKAVDHARSTPDYPSDRAQAFADRLAELQKSP